MMSHFILPATGWTYCPRCDADNMLATEPGKLYECPMCGMGLRVTTMKGEPVGLEATQPLHFLELVRYGAYMQKIVQAAHTEQKKVAIKPYMPWRVRLCFKLFRIVGWPFGCEVKIITDKKVKEVTNEQKKG